MADTTLEVLIKAFVEGLDQIKGLSDAVAGSVAGVDQLGVAGSFLQGVVEGMVDELKKYVDGLNDTKDGHDKANKSVSKFGATLGEAKDKVEELGSKLLELTGITTLIGTVLSALSIERFFEEGFQGAEKLEDALARLSVASGQASDDLKDVGEQASKIGANLGIDSSDSVDALTALTSGVGNVDKAMQALEPTLQLAKVANIGVADSAQAVTTVLNQYGLSADQASDVTDTLIATSQNAAIGLGDLVTQFRLVGPFAANAGLSFKDTATILGGVAEQGLRGRQAFSALIEVFSQLGTASSDFRQRLEGIGVDTSNLGTVFQQLAQKGSAGQFAIAAFSDRTRAVLQKLLADGGANLDALGGKLDNVAGTSKKAADEIEATFSQSLTRLKISFGNLAEALATPTLAPLADAFDSLKGKLEDFAKTPAFATLVKAFTQLVNDGIKFLTDALGSIPWDKASEAVAGFFDTFTKYADQGVVLAKTTGNVLATIAQSVALVFNTLKTVVATGVEIVVAGAVLALNALAGLQQAAGDFTAAQASLKTASQLTETLKELDGVAESAAHDVGNNLSSIADHITALGNTSKSVKQTSDSLGTLGAGATALGKVFPALGTAIETIDTGLHDLKAAVDNTGVGEQTVDVVALGAAYTTGGESIDKYNDVIQVTGTSVKALTGQLTDLDGPLEGLGTAFDKNTKFAAGIEIQLENVSARMVELAQNGQGTSVEFQALAQSYQDLSQKLAGGGGISSADEQLITLQNNLHGTEVELSNLVQSGQGFGKEAQQLADYIRQLQVQIDALHGPIESLPNISNAAANALANLGVDAQGAITKANAAATEFKTVFAELGTSTPQNLKISQAAFEAWAQKAIASFAFVDDATKQNVIAMLEQAAASVQDIDGLNKLLDTANKVGSSQKNLGQNIKQGTDQITKATGDIVAANGTVTDSQTNMVFANQQVADSFREQSKDAADFANNVSGTLGPALDAESASLTNFASHGVNAVNAFTKAMTEFFNGEGAFSAEAAADGTKIIQFANAVGQANQLISGQIQQQLVGVSELADQYANMSNAAILALSKTKGGADNLERSLEGDAAAAREGHSAFDLLGASDLGPLSAALDQVAQRVEQVKEAAQQAADSLKSLLASTQDQIDQINGNQQAIEQRRHEEALAQIEALKAQGADDETVDKATKAENELHSLKMKDIQDAAAEQQKADADAAAKATADAKAAAAQQKADAQQQQQALQQQLTTQTAITDQVTKASPKFVGGPNVGRGAIGGGLAGVGGSNAPSDTRGAEGGPLVTVVITNALGTPDQLADVLTKRITQTIVRQQALSR